ncbi:DUF1569 domain-containing protein [Flavobacterium nackdongense]|uniref:DUF1569 domain-containing protein n=1 Tax=Flavobacterium nackdongense TaxID=2547394 RepID=A0A4P6YC98_9FLAO|nr:DUF1569 domain-containing protein [Flavobacterium nackdongense]QBN18305.1 DUF1569 domain-containing protein [Flavobacterium nackdongense]
MSSIYNASDNAAILSRIESLKPESKALWGKMTVDQMLKHTNEAILIAFDEKTLKINFLMRFLGKMMKHKIFNSEFKKNSPTAPEFIFKEHYDFEAAKKDLTINFSRFAQGPEAIKITEHPFWGKMTSEDWDKLMWKHLDHHLKQFGV